MKEEIEAGSPSTGHFEKILIELKGLILLKPRLRRKREREAVDSLPAYNAS
jgi:hypothetical protein